MDGVSHPVDGELEGSAGEGVTALADGDGEDEFTVGIHVRAAVGGEDADDAVVRTAEGIALEGKLGEVGDAVAIGIAAGGGIGCGVDGGDVGERPSVVVEVGMGP